MEEGEIEDGEIEDDSCESTVVETNNKSSISVGKASVSVGPTVTSLSSKQIVTDDRRDKPPGVGLGLDTNARPSGSTSKLNRKRPYYGSGYDNRTYRSDNFRNEKQYDNNILSRNSNQPKKVKKRQYDIDNDGGDLGYWVDVNTGSTFVEKYNGRKREGPRRASKNEGIFKKGKNLEFSQSRTRDRNGDVQPYIDSGNSISTKSGSHSNAKDPEDFEQLLKEYQIVSEAIIREKEKIKQTEKEVNDESLTASASKGKHDSQIEIKQETKDTTKRVHNKKTDKAEKSCTVVPIQTAHVKEKEENDDDDELLELRLAALTSLAQKDAKENKSKQKQDNLPKKSESLSSSHSTRKRSATSRRSSAISRSRNKRRSLHQSRQRLRSRSTNGARLRTTRDILSIDDEEERMNQFLLYLKETPEATDMPASGLSNKEDCESEMESKSGNDTTTTTTLGDDNYEEVEMDIDDLHDSEEKSEEQLAGVSIPDPASDSHTTTVKSEEQPPILGTQHISLPPLPTESNLTKPPEPEEDEDEEEILALRQLLLKNMKNNQKMKATDVKATQDSKLSQGSSPARTPRSESPTVQKPAKKKPAVISIPVHKEVVINLNDDSDTSDEENAPSGYNSILDQFLKEARKKADANKPKTTTANVASLAPKTPEAMKQLSTTQQAEYKRLKEEIAKREKFKKLKGITSSNQSPVQSDLDSQSQDESDRNVRKLTVTFAPEEDGKRQIGINTHTKMNDVELNAKKIQEAVEKELKKKAAEEKEKKIKMVEEKLNKFRSAIEKDENTFEGIEQRLEKKKSTFKLAMAKITKLTEQLDMVQRVANANKNSIITIQAEKNELNARLNQLKSRESQLLEALADVKGVTLEEVLKTHPAVKKSKINTTMGKTAAHGSVGKSNMSNKQHRLTSEKQTVLAKERSELTRLQELEKMYAEKIAKFKESHKLKKRLVASPAVSKVLKEAKVTENIKPSKQLYLKDKINVPSTSGMNDGEVNIEFKTQRRRSWLDEEASVMKPCLSKATSPTVLTAEQDLAVNKLGIKNSDSPANELSVSDSTANKPSVSDFPANERGMKESTVDVKSSVKNLPQKQEIIQDRIFNPEEIEKLKKLQERREKVLRFFDWTSSIDAHVSVGDAPDLPSDIKVDLASRKSTPIQEVKATSLHTYESPLLALSAYRFDPLFKELNEAESEGSETFCNKIDPTAIFCRFDLNGRCNDDDCKWQHERNCKMSFEEKLAHLVSFNVSIVGATEKSTLQQIQRKVWLFAKMKCQELKTNSDEEKQKMLEKVQNLVLSKSKSLQLEPRRWKVTQKTKNIKMETKDEVFTDEDVKLPSESGKVVNLVDPDFVDEEDLRYFASDVGTCQLENAVLQKPNDIQLWLKLAYKQLSKPGNSNIDKALHALSRGLDNNRHDPELWMYYLTLFNKRSADHNDVMEMCNHAIHYTNDYDVWHKTLSIANSIEEKDNLCEELLQVLQKEQENNPTDRGSHRLLEMLLFRVHLYLLVGAGSDALVVLKDCVYKNGMVVIDLLSSVDKGLVWLSFIHLKYFKQLPPCLFDPNSSAPTRLVSKKSFLCPWTKSNIVNLDEIRRDLHNAIECCQNKDQSAVDNVLNCMPLYENLVHMYIACDNSKEALSTCRRLVKDCPEVDELWILLLKTQRTCNHPNQTYHLESVVEEALSCNHNSASIYLTAASYAFKDGNVGSARSLLHRCAATYFKEDLSYFDALTLYRKLLNQPLPYIAHPPHCSDDVKENVMKQKVFIWICYALLNEINGNESSTVEAYEVALFDLHTTKDIQTIWLGYLKYQLRKLKSSTVQNTQTWHDLVNRCLMTSVSRFPLPHNSSKSWVDYNFHNQVINLYLATIKEQDKLDVSERLLSMMPKNILLLLRVCQFAVLAERPQQAFMHCKTFLHDQPYCVQAWKVAIHLQLITKNYNQVHHLYSKALSSNPLVLQLWTNFLLFLVAHGSILDVNQTVSASAKYGIDLKKMTLTILQAPR